MGRGGPDYMGGPLPEMQYMKEQPGEVYAYCPDWKNAHYGLARLGQKYRAIDPFLKFDDPPAVTGAMFVWPASGTIVGVVGACCYQATRRRPLFAQIWIHLSVGAASSALGYFAWKRSRSNAAIRDAIIKHYVNLHPDDFPEIERKKIGHVLRNWCTAR